jgi:hypothetical protein
VRQVSSSPAAGKVHRLVRSRSQSPDSLQCSRLMVPPLPSLSLSLYVSVTLRLGYRVGLGHGQPTRDGWMRSSLTNAPVRESFATRRRNRGRASITSPSGHHVHHLSGPTQPACWRGGRRWQGLSGPAQRQSHLNLEGKKGSPVPFPFSFLTQAYPTEPKFPQKPRMQPPPKTKDPLSHHVAASPIRSEPYPR